jgi:hypothetical protein
MEAVRAFAVAERAPLRVLAVIVVVGAVCLSSTLGGLVGG